MLKSISCRFIAAFFCFLFPANGVASAACTYTTQLTPVFGSFPHVFSAVTMLRPDNSWIVGSAGFGNHMATLAEHFNGSQWTVVPTPRVPVSPNDSFSTFTSVVALSANDVWAVGGSGVDSSFDQGTAFIEHWNGSAWAVVPSPNVNGDSVFASVTATSTTNVWAAGSYVDLQYPHAHHVLVEEWNGTAWSVVPDPNDAPMTSISATSSTDVWATAGDIQHWNGSQWSVISTLPATAVSADSASDAWAIVSLNQIAHWNGSVWQVVSSPQIGTLTSIAANAPNNAWAVGSNNGAVLTEHWNGSAWSIVTSPAVPSAGLSSVALSGRYAVAVGSHAQGQRQEIEGLNQFWTGSKWRLGTDTIVDHNSNGFGSIYASSANDAWAFGFQQPNFYGSGVLLERWNGTAWSRVDVSITGFAVAGVGGSSPDDIWAAGTGSSSNGCGGNPDAAALHWNGVGWTSTSLVCGEIQAFVNGMADYGPRDVWVVGGYTQQGGMLSILTFPFAEHLTAHGWVEYTMPDDLYNVGFSGGLYAIAGSAPSDVWALGRVGITQAYHFDGTTWSFVNIPFPKAVVSFNAVAAPGANDAWVAGTQSDKRFGGGFTPLFMHWDGNSWTEIPHPAVLHGGIGRLVAVASNDIWAFGASSSQQYVLHWDGAAWSIVRTQLPTGFGIGGAAVIPGTNEVWAVGSYPTAYSSQALSAIFHC